MRDSFAVMTYFTYCPSCTRRRSDAESAHEQVTNSAILRLDVPTQAELVRDFLSLGIMFVVVVRHCILSGHPTGEVSTFRYFFKFMRREIQGPKFCMRAGFCQREALEQERIACRTHHQVILAVVHIHD